MDDPAQPASKTSTPLPTGIEPGRLDFVILQEFPLYALVPAIEALRLANQTAGRRLYDWRLLSVDGQSVTSGSGVTLPVQGSIADVVFSPMAIVCAGNHPLQHVSRPLLNWLRRLDRHGAILGAIDTGAFVLAEAGLLKNHVITLHWEAIALFRDTYAGIDVREQLFIFDSNRITCAGGHASLDMMLHLIRIGHGTALAQVVANAFISPDMRESGDAQRFAPANRDEETSRIARIIRTMERNVAIPLKATELAVMAHIDERAMSRAFRRSLGDSPMHYYLKLRLQMARNDLFYTSVAIGEIADRYGFSHVEVFSRAFKTHYGLSPSAYRQNFSREELKRFRPELDQVAFGRSNS
jgi:AraC family carnitine catabolism transcriptional activator